MLNSIKQGGNPPVDMGSTTAGSVEHALKVAIIGGGWYGCTLALFLRAQGMRVTLFDKKRSIFLGVSGDFGVRVHAGPHYPRSAETRKCCQEGLRKFTEEYPELINQHQYSLYALGKIDADGNPPKVDADTFRTVCNEVEGSREINPQKAGYQGVSMVMDVPEPSCVVGSRLRNHFLSRLVQSGVDLRFKTAIISSLKLAGARGILLSSDKHKGELFDSVINTTGFQSLLPNGALPFGMEVRYQPCLALKYKDLRQKPSEDEQRPFSTIMMDGWFPCIMPYDDRPEKTGEPSDTYIVTHGKWTIMGSHVKVEDAREQLRRVSEHFIDEKIRPYCEKELSKFWPEFNKHSFDYMGWKGAVLAKVKTNGEFRSAVTFQSNDSGVIYVFPGKISNVFDVQSEVLQLIHNESSVISEAGYSYMRGGVLDCSRQEIKEEVKGPNTCELQTYDELTSFRFGPMFLVRLAFMLLFSFMVTKTWGRAALLYLALEVLYMVSQERATIKGALITNVSNALQGASVLSRTVSDLSGKVSSLTGEAAIQMRSGSDPSLV